MRLLIFVALGVFGVALACVSLVRGYVEAPHTLGRVCYESTNIVLVEVDKVDKTRGLIIFKKLRDIKGNHPEVQIKHNIGQRGFHAREWQNVMAWAEAGKKAVFFHNGGASETCIGTYWYQCYREGEWWGMTHAEPYLLRTFCGVAEKLAAAAADIVAGREVVVPCFADGNVNQLHERKGKLQRLKAGLKLLDYNPRRDFVAFGGDGGDIPEFKTVILLGTGSTGWKFIPAGAVPANGRWQQDDFNDAGWRTGRAPIGYGEEEIAKRKGTTVAEKGQAFVFRREFQVPAELLARKGVVFRLGVASDDSALVYLNGKLADQDPVSDHEFAYWNRDLEVPANLLRAGGNLVAVLVKNHPQSSDLYLDMEIVAQVSVTKTLAQQKSPGQGRPAPQKTPVLKAEPLPAVLKVDKQSRTVTLPCAIAPRKLPNLKDIYPIEVLATYPAPRGQKAHETLVTFDAIRPSMLHQALVQVGLKPGTPARGDNARASGPELLIFLEFVDAAGKRQKLPVHKALADRGGKPLGKVAWHFTGSSFRRPDPEKDELVYGANLTGTLIALFPVTDDTVIQSSLTLRDESLWRLDKVQGLPAEGAAANMVIQAAK
jgi:hypothetical protein